MGRDSKPDYFPAEFDDFQASRRATPNSMGGARPILPAAPVGPPRRRPIDPAQARDDRRYQQQLTRVVQLRASGTVPASGPLVIDIDGPQIGYAWDLKQFIVGPADMTVLPYATGVTTILFIRSQSSSRAGAADNSANQAQTWTAVWPAQGFFGPHECPLVQGDQAQVVIVGLPANTLVTVGATAEETAADVRELWSN